VMNMTKVLIFELWSQKVGMSNFETMMCDHDSISLKLGFIRHIIISMGNITR